MTSAGRAFPLRALILLWLAIETVMVIVFAQTLRSGEYGDADDFMRLVQVRDLLHGQNWWDLAQHRVNPPAGLPMHWSRLVDIPIIAVLAPLSVLVGERWAETAALVVAPAATLLVLMIAVTHAMRRLFGPAREMTLFASILLLSAPLILVQIHPARIDHHGWQIASAAVAFAALLDRRALRSGLIAGSALGCYIAISIEGLPYAVAAVGAVALLWALGRDSGTRLAALTGALFLTSLACFMLASPGDWRSTYCDQLAPSHLVVLGLAAVGVAAGVRARGTVLRLTLLGGTAAVAGASFYHLAPICLTQPYGRMDPLVYRLWFLSVSEGLPIWRQTPMAAVGMVAFPLLGLIGSVMAWRAARSRESARRWSIVVLLGIATLITGTLVRRSAGVSHVIALPGAFVIIYWLSAHATVVRRVAIQSVARAAALIVCSPLMPVYAAAVTLDRSPAEGGGAKAPPTRCDWHCGMRRLAQMPPMTVLGGIDLGPTLLAMTPHSTYAAGYHRLQGPMRQTIATFMAPPDRAEAAVRATGLGYVLIAPQSDEHSVFEKEAPNGLLARLSRGQIPGWLEPVDLGSPELKLFRVRR